VLAAAGAIAVVSAITFGILLEALLDQQRVAGPARATSDARYAIATVQRLALETQLGDADARAQLPGAVDRLAAVPNDEPQRRRIGLLTAAAAGQRWNAVRTLLAQLDASERAKLTQIRAQSQDARDRAIATASVGFAVLLIIVGIVSFGAVRAVVSPVARLQTFARELGARRYGVRLPESGPPETIELAQAFNATAVSLAAAEAELREIGERHLAQLDAVFSEAPLGHAFVDRELRFLRVNEELARFNRRPVAAHLGKPVRNDDARAALAEVVEHGRAILDREFTSEGRVYLASYFPVHDVVGAAVIDITERRRAEAARERLQHITAELAAAVTVPQVARAAVAEAQAAFETEGAAVLLVAGERLELCQFLGLSEAAQARLAIVALDDPRPVAAAVRLGHPVYVESPEQVAADYPVLAGLVPALSALPLIASGGTVGVLLVDFTQPRVLDGDERDLIEAIAGQTAVALERAQLYEREHTVAQTLQASLLPRALPVIPGLDLAARLHAGATGIEVGGDFYDAFAIGDGAWGLAIGDVCGKGVDAAALTALSRHTMRAAAVEGHSPADVLRALNRAVLADARLGQVLTAIFARLDGTTLTVACGGQPPPVLLGADGAQKPLESAGTLLGVLDDPDVSDTVVELSGGDTLLLYTDGLTEAGAPARTLATEDVAALLAAARSDTAAETVEHVLARALELGGGVIRDDVAVLVAQPSTAGRSSAGESSTRGQ
jgi:serine phosphatase RsbU (regulator of sigma subunit)/PAS domain-containing protein